MVAALCSVASPRRKATQRSESSRRLRNTIGAQRYCAHGVTSAVAVISVPFCQRQGSGKRSPCQRCCPCARHLFLQGGMGAPLMNPPLFRGHAVPTPGRRVSSLSGPLNDQGPAAPDPSAPLFFALRQGKSDVLQICFPALRLSATLEQSLEQGLRPSHPGLVRSRWLAVLSQGISYR